MDIEQLPPNQPNFGVVVGLFCATLLVVFVLALVFLRVDSGHLTFRHHRAHPTSHLQLPTTPNSSLSA